MKFDDRKIFEEKCNEEIIKQSSDKTLSELSNQWLNKAAYFNYSHHFKWLGVPVIQHPSDLIIMQELLYKIKPDLIIETGVARGGSLIFYSSIMDMIWGKNDPKNGKIIGIDIDIRKHNRDTIEKHFLNNRIQLIEGSSIDIFTKEKVYSLCSDYKNIMVILDSNHTYDHVLEELKIYSPLVSTNSYCVVLDTIIEYLDEELIKYKTWSKNDNPLTAVETFLKNNKNFVIDNYYEDKALITVAPNGFLRKVSSS